MAILDAARERQAIAVDGPVGVKYRKGRTTVLVPQASLFTVKMVMGYETARIDIKPDDRGGITIEEPSRRGTRKTSVNKLLSLPVGEGHPRITFRRLPENWALTEQTV